MALSFKFQPSFKDFFYITSYLTFQGKFQVSIQLLFPLAGLLLVAVHTLTPIQTTTFDIFATVLALLYWPIIIFITSYSTYNKLKGHSSTLVIDDEGISQRRVGHL